MASSYYLSNPVVTVNSVALTDQVTSASFIQRYDSLEATSFGDTDRKYVKGLENNELTLTMYMSYASAETYATLAALVGSTTTVRVQPTSGADGPTNPGFILTGCYLEELPVINATMGELSTIDVTFTGGVYSVDVTP
jgi:hypothetical protein